MIDLNHAKAEQQRNSSGTGGEIMEITSAYLKRLENRTGKPWQGNLKYRDPENPARFKSLSKTFDRETVRTKTQAMRALEAWRATVEAGEVYRALPTVSVFEYVRDATQTRAAAKNLERSTLYGYRFMLAHIEKGFEGVAMRDLDAGKVERWIGGLNAQGLAPATIRKAHRLLKQACTRAQRERLLSENPCLFVELPASQKQAPNVLDRQGCNRLVTLLAGMDRTAPVIAAYIALYTGLRRGEICALRWNDIDLEAGEISVNSNIAIREGGTYEKPPKTERGRRVVPMPSALIPVLAVHRAFALDDWRAFNRAVGLTLDDAEYGRTYVIGAPDGTYCNPTMLGKSWQALATAHNLTGTQGRVVTLHDLRHTYATLAVADRADIKSISSNLGHANTAITLDIYAADDAAAKRRTAETVGNAIGAPLDSLD